MRCLTARAAVAHWDGEETRRERDRFEADPAVLDDIRAVAQGGRGAKGRRSHRALRLTYHAMTQPLRHRPRRYPARSSAAAGSAGSEAGGPLWDQRFIILRSSVVLLSHFVDSSIRGIAMRRCRAWQGLDRC